MDRVDAPGAFARCVRAWRVARGAVCRGRQAGSVHHARCDEGVGRSVAAGEAMGRTGAADRVRALPPYLFVEIDRVKRELAASGREIFDLGIGDPDLPTPAFVVEALAAAAKDPATHRYPDGAGLPAFREAVAAFYKDRFAVTLDPATEVLALIGS